MVAAFGGFLMGGDVVVGLIVFAILLVVNFMVVTKGSGRIAEVAARFSLDAMPGKQMAIDADLSAGLIDETEARRRRGELEEESDFYGAMDGAASSSAATPSPALIITVINIVGGLAIGVLRHGMSHRRAAADLHHADGRRRPGGQIPALLVSVAAGIVVTKGGGEARRQVLIRQLGGGWKPLAHGRRRRGMMALMPGMPMLPFLALAGPPAAGPGSAQAPAGSRRPTRRRRPGRAGEPPVADALRLDLLRLELGYGLLALAGGEAPRLTEQIRGLRRAMAARWASCCRVRIQDNLELPPDAYILRVKEIEAGRGQLRPPLQLAIDPRGEVPAMAGERTREPTFGLPALWIEEGLRDEALARGCTVVDCAGVLATHLTETVRDNMAELLSFAETQKLLDELPPEHQKLVADVIPSQIGTGGLQRVLQALLAERVSIRDLPTILEGVQEATAAGSRGIGGILGVVRARLARQLATAARGPGGYVPLIALSADWEPAFAESLAGPPEDRQLAMAPSPAAGVHAAAARCLRRRGDSGEAPVLVCSGGIRAHVRAIVERFRPATMVLSQAEIHPRARIRTLGQV